MIAVPNEYAKLDANAAPTMPQRGMNRRSKPTIVASIAEEASDTRWGFPLPARSPEITLNKLIATAPGKRRSNGIIVCSKTFPNIRIIRGLLTIAKSPAIIKVINIILRIILGVKSLEEFELVLATRGKSNVPAMLDIIQRRSAIPIATA